MHPGARLGPLDLRVDSLRIEVSWELWNRPGMGFRMLAGRHQTGNCSEDGVGVEKASIHSIHIDLRCVQYA